eukprot:TRINITY_DN31849_c0_g1_i2.p1 TRINITY_DN31849_c0_g1~~TRINITY_DN31849_c0_g1_i2.p1  ORF type:complete len:105 (-),score=21.76 TRINITY_DN31849_c0_g1_i2:2-316(-)
MTDCSVHGTQDATRAAVEAAGGREGNCVVAAIKRCTVRSNKGVGIRLRGAVKHTLEENICKESEQGDFQILYCEENDSWPIELKKPSGCYEVIYDTLTSQDAKT